MVIFETRTGYVNDPAFEGSHMMKGQMIFLNRLFVSALFIVLAFGLTTIRSAAKSPLPKENKLTCLRQDVPFAGPGSSLPLNRRILSVYDGPLYNPEGQQIGSYCGPILGYSTSCNILTPIGYLYICQNFTY